MVDSTIVSGRSCDFGKLDDNNNSFYHVNRMLQAISKKSFIPISLLEAKFKSSEYLSIPPV
jgi:hypothetical protein